MVETLGQGSVDVLPVQPMDSHFIYHTVNLKTPNALQHKLPAPENTHHPNPSVTLSFYQTAPCSLNHACIVFAMDQLKG